MDTVTVDCILARMPFKKSIEIFEGEIEGPISVFIAILNQWC